MHTHIHVNACTRAHTHTHNVYTQINNNNDLEFQEITSWCRSTTDWKHPVKKSAPSWLSSSKTPCHESRRREQDEYHHKWWRSACVECMCIWNVNATERQEKVARGRAREWRDQEKGGGLKSVWRSQERKLAEAPERASAWWTFQIQQTLLLISSTQRPQWNVWPSKTSTPCGKTSFDYDGHMQETRRSGFGTLLVQPWQWCGFPALWLSQVVRGPITGTDPAKDPSVCRHTDSWAAHDGSTPHFWNFPRHWSHREHACHPFLHRDPLGWPSLSLQSSQKFALRSLCSPPKNLLCPSTNVSIADFIIP